MSLNPLTIATHSHTNKPATTHMHVLSPAVQCVQVHDTHMRLAATFEMQAYSSGSGILKLNKVMELVI